MQVTKTTPTKTTITLLGEVILIHFTISAFRRLREKYPEMNFESAFVDDLITDLIFAGQDQTAPKPREWIVGALDDFESYDPAEINKVYKAFEAASGAFQKLLLGNVN